MKFSTASRLAALPAFRSRRNAKVEEVQSLKKISKRDEKRKTNKQKLVRVMIKWANGTRKNNRKLTGGKFMLET